MNQKAKPTPSAPLPRGKRLWFIAVTVCLPIVLLLVVEGALRLFGFGGYDPVLRKAGDVPEGSLIISDQAGAISYFYANRSRPGFNEQYHFLSPKPKGVFRIFIVGESAAKGYPQPRNLASSAFLEKMLSDAWPDRKVEVINLGTTAVASFPVLGMMTEALQFEPDLIIIHTGHNEFFGAYGVASISRGGAGVGSLKAIRWLRSLAIIQAASRWVGSDDLQKGKTLMEIMAARSYTAPDDPLRKAAAGNLGANISEMLNRCHARGVPAIVCTMPSNDRDLHPVGEDRLDQLSTDEQKRFTSLFHDGQLLLESNPQQAADKFAAAVSVDSRHAGVRFFFGRALYLMGRTNEAQREFDAARDLDSMPWRATRVQQAAIRDAAARHEAALCDLISMFRSKSPGGCIGWELMDDHVHPTLRGQALMAEGFVSTLRQMRGAAAVSETQYARIKPYEAYAEQLGENPYDTYAVDHTMRVLFSVSFMRENNPEALRRFDERARAFEAALPQPMLNMIREWQSEVPHAGGKRPITGMIAREFMREKRYDDALKLFQIAQQSVPEYTSWHMEYVYFALACREKLAGKLNEEERKLALSEIEQGQFLLRRGFSQTGFAERYTGRLHQLRGEFAEAIPYLNASREKLSGFDLVAADQALFVSFLKTGRRDDARKLVENGVANSGQYSGFYKQMQELLEKNRAADAAAE
jgi:tetratricopeptide (TPR) repeat protein